MDKLKKLDQQRKRKLFGCILCILIGFYLLSVLRAKQYRDDQFKIANPNLQIGILTERQNDVRRRQKISSDWLQTVSRDIINLGDSLYVSNESQATLQFRGGGAMVLGENSLAHFQQVENERMPRLVCGNFLVQVEDSLRIKIGSEVTTLEGRGDVQIFLSLNHKPQVKTLRGVVTLRNKTAAIPPPDAEDVSLCPDSSVQNYVWRLYDLYEQKEMTLLERSPAPTSVFANYPVSWGPEGGPAAKVQLSSTSDFAQSVEFISALGRINFPKLHAGENYWRVSLDGSHWSAPQKIVVKPRFLPAAAPHLEDPEVQVPLFQQITTIEMKMRAPVPVVGFVAEASLDPNFAPGTTRHFWSPQESLRLSFYKPGVYFYRFRSVNAKQEISEWSATQKFDVFTPRLAKHKARHRNRQVAKVDHELRTPTSVDTSSVMKYEPEPIETRRNQKYRDARLSLEGFMWTLQSSQQYYQNQASPVASGVGLSYQGWSGAHGLEANIKSGVMGMNASGKQTALRDFEGRYHYRFVTGFPFNLARELQTSLFMGYEMYRNTGDGFSSQYDLLKFGTSLEFPLAYRWSTGGELVFGQSTDKSTKKEISGHVSYFLNHDWSLGAGYRLHLFEAGGEKSAPGGLLPYREGYTEGYSILNYHF